MKHSASTFACSQLIASLLVLFTPYANGQGVVINEFMAKNVTTIQDIDGDFSDWIELYNPTDSTINLYNFGLSDDDDELYKWVFPEATIPSQGYLLVFASDKNITDTTELHTNFKISSGGEKLFLSNDCGELTDQTGPVQLNADQSYGRVPDGYTNWIVIHTPTPDGSNNDINQLTFSHQAGFYTTPFSLIISTLFPDTVYYTLNGNTPTESSCIYSDSIFIFDRSPLPNTISEIPTSPDQTLISYKAWESPSDTIHKATVLKCASYSHGKRTSKIYTKTFFVDNEMFDKYTLPVISISTDANNLFSPDSGIFVPGVFYDSTNPQFSGNYFQHGKNWERKSHFEYFDCDGTIGFSQDAGIRIHGGKTRHAAQKSMRIYAREEYGKEYFEYNLLPKRQNNKYKRFILETTMSDWGPQTIFRDQYAQDISSPLNLDHQSFQAVIVYVNGEFWGVYTIRDRIDDKYIEYTHNVDNDSVEFWDHDNTSYDSLVQFIEQNNLESATNYEYVTQQIEIDNYIDYLIAEFFFANYDWPGNNMRFWRKIPGGKWRWIFFDLDGGFGNENYNMLIHTTINDTSVIWPNPPSSTFLFRNLLKNKTFKAQLIDRYAEILNWDFDTEKMTSKLDSIKEIYAPEMADHIGRWNYPDSYVIWEEAIENCLRSFVENRPCVVRDHIMEFFDLSDFDFNCNLAFDENKNNNLILSPNPNNGNFFLINRQADIKDATILVMNLTGQIVYIEHGIRIMQNEMKQFAISGLLNNTYIFQIKSDNFSGQMKFQIIK